MKIDSLWEGKWATYYLALWILMAYLLNSGHVQDEFWLYSSQSWIQKIVECQSNWEAITYNFFPIKLNFLSIPKKETFWWIPST